GGNDRYRNRVRHFWRGDQGALPGLASRLAGSSDIYEHSHRSAYASVNFIIAHDGYTLHDLVTYEQKHNVANGENNQDGHNENISRNWGTEGETGNERIIEIRERSKRNFLATLLLSQGVPMLSHGDEVSRTQRGNNNGYAQDNEITWVDWNLDERRKTLLDFTQKVVAIRQENPVLRRRHFLRGQVVDDEGNKDVSWLGSNGEELTQADWDDKRNHVLGMLIDGDATDETDSRGRPIKGDTLLLLLNGGETDVDFQLPEMEKRGRWGELIDTAGRGRFSADAESIPLVAYSLVLLRYGVERRIAPELPSRSEMVGVEGATG
ncbi:MAG: glycogen debranching enzyme, partial [Gemmatimonadaceae bacterium]